MRTAAGSVDAAGTALEGLSTLTKALAGGVFDIFGVSPRPGTRGYVQIIVDVRGTQVPATANGRSSVPANSRIPSRSSTGCASRTGATASSAWPAGRYSAINSLQAADKRPEGLGAVFAVEGCDDIVRDIYITGGMPSAFIPAWLSVVNLLKWLPNPSTLMRDMVRPATPFAGRRHGSSHRPPRWVRSAGAS